jgi:hypothetical protein
MAQILRPDSDAVLTEIGSSTPAYTSLDEATPSDADYAWSNDNTIARLEVGIQNPSGTPASGTITIRYRIALTDSGTVIGSGSASTVIARLIEGTSVLSSDAQRTATGTWTQYSWNVSTSVVTDWTNLRVRFDITGGGGSPANRRGMGVSWTEVEVPDAATTVSGSFTADAYISVGVNGSFTADAYLKRLYVGSSDSNQQTSHNFNSNTEGFVSDDGGSWNSGLSAINWNGSANAGQTDTNHWTRTFTWEDLGVPAGAIVVGFRLDNISTRWSIGTGTGYTVNPDKVDLLDNSNSLLAALLASRTATVSEGTFVSRSSPLVALDGLPSGQTVKLQITQQITAGGNTLAGGIATDVVQYTVFWTVPFGFTANAYLVEPLTGTLAFAEGFETNDTSRWDSTAAAGDGSVATASGSAKTGGYGLHIAETATAVSGSYARKNHTATDTVRAAGWFRSPTEGASGNNNANLRIFSAGVRIVDVYRQNSTGEMWLRTRKNDGTFRFDNTGQTRSTNVWYRWDVTVKYNGVGAVSRIVVKLDGTTYIDASDFDLDAGSFDMVQVGAEHPNQYLDLDVDDVIVELDPVLDGGPTVGSFTADAYIKRVGLSGSFTADAFIRRTGLTGSFTADAFVQRVGVAGSVTADAFIRRTFSGSVTADANIAATVTGLFTVDAYVKKTQSKSFTADAYITGITGGSFTADAFIKRVGISESFTADAYLRATLAGSFTADAYIRRTFGQSFSADAFVRVTQSGSLTANAFVRRTFDSTFTADAYVSALVTGSFTADAEIAPPEPGERLGSFTADAFILRTGLNGSFTADAFIARTASDSFVADAFIRRTFAQSFVADAFIRVLQTGSFVADAFLRRTFSGLFSADAHIAATVLSSFTLDAHILNPNATQNITGSTSVSVMGRFGGTTASSWASGIRLCPVCGKRHTTASRGLSGTTTVSTGD